MWLRLCIVGIISRVGTSLGCLMFNSFPLNQLSKIVHRRLPVVTFRSNRSTDFHTFFPSFFLLRYSMICRAIYLEARLIDRYYIIIPPIKRVKDRCKLKMLFHLYRFRFLIFASRRSSSYSRFISPNNYIPNNWRSWRKKRIFRFKICRLEDSFIIYIN